MEKLDLYVNCPSYVIAQDGPFGTNAVSGIFKSKDNAILELKSRVKAYNNNPVTKDSAWGKPYLVELTVNMNTVDVLDFADIVKDSHRACSERCSADWPTSSMIAEDIVDNYEDYKNVDLSDPDKYNKWLSEVQIELNRQGLVYKEEE